MQICEFNTITVPETSCGDCLSLYLAHLKGRCQSTPAFCTQTVANCVADCEIAKPHQSD